MNLYGYVHNSPLNFVDPFGLSEADDVAHGFRYTAYTMPVRNAPYPGAPGYTDPFGNWSPTFCLSCHGNTPTSDFYKQQSVLANALDYKVLAYEQLLGAGLTLGFGSIAEEMAAARNMNLVRQLGQAGERCAGITGPKTRIPSLTGTAAYRVPDELNPSTLREIKNVAQLNRVTGQLEDFALFSQQTQRQFVLEIRQNTVIAPTVDQYLQLNRVNVVRSLPIR